MKHLRFRRPVLFLAGLWFVLYRDHSGLLRVGLLAALLHECGHVAVWAAMTKSLPVLSFSVRGIGLDACAALLSRRQTFLLALAVPGTLGLAVYVVRWVLLRSASAQRVAAMAEALGATAALVFLVVLAKSLLAASPDGARRTALWGVLAFGCGFCMLLPQALLRAGVPGAMPLPIALVCAAAGLEVRRLVRIAEGELSLGGLQTGKWRHLTSEELDWLLKLS